MPPMLRYAVLGLIGFVTGAALAQQAPPPEGTPAASASSASIEPAKAVVAMEEPLPGDHWTYEVRDETTGTVKATRTNVVTEVTPTDISMRFKVVRTDKTSFEGFNILDRSWNLLSDGPWQYLPYNGSTGIQTPLTVGKTWTFESSDANNNYRDAWKQSGTSKVVGQETLTTRAGTFETFKIEITSSRRNSRDPSSATETTMTNWYAPTIDHWVKRTYAIRVGNDLRENNTLELIEYGRRYRRP
jgi:hypothetical protein